jgi:radical SAM-linked protein
MTTSTTDPNGASLRHRITFGTRRTLAYISVLELGTLWERTLRRARVPVKYSQGYNPRPRMHFAAPLPVGCGSEADLLDVELDEPRTAGAIEEALRDVTPMDLTVVAVTAVSEDEEALSEQLVETVYRTKVRDVPRRTVEDAVARLMDAETWPMPKRGRKHRGKTYDLRALIHELRLEPAAEGPWTDLWMRLNAQPGATGRPDEVLKALDLAEAPRRCARVALILTE